MQAKISVLYNFNVKIKKLFSDALQTKMLFQEEKVLEVKKKVSALQLFKDLIRQISSCIKSTPFLKSALFIWALPKCGVPIQKGSSQISFSIA